MAQTKVGAVVFEHKHNYSGEVEILRGAAAIKVPFDALEKIVADKVRAQLIENIEKLTPTELLHLSAAKK